MRQPPFETPPVLVARRARRLAALAVAVALAGSVVMVGTAQPSSAAPTEPAPTLTFATWNVCKLMCDAPAPSWSVRRTRVARGLNESGADVIAVTEATDWRFRSGTQWDDIIRITRPGGYAAPVIQSDRCRRSGCTRTARILFKPQTVKQMNFGRKASAGYLRVRDIAPQITYDSDRQVTWAFLRGRNGTGPFLAVSVHLTNSKSPEGEQHRLAFGQAATSWAEAMTASHGIPGAPIVLMGDLNSIDDRQPQGVQQELRDGGWTDAINAPSRANVDVNAINYTPLLPSGWPIWPIRNTHRLASRIDYIMTRGAATAQTYEVVLHLNPDGSFDQKYQGSDHLMVRARLQFGG